MKAIELNKPGGLDQLQLVEHPDPGRPGPGEIRVRVHASSLNFHDYLIAAAFRHQESGQHFGKICLEF